MRMRRGDHYAPHIVRAQSMLNEILMADANPKVQITLHYVPDHGSSFVPGVTAGGALDFKRR